MLFTDLRPRRARLADEGRGHELSATLANLTQGQDLVVMVARASPSPARQRPVFTTAIPATARLLAPSPAPAPISADNGMVLQVRGGGGGVAVAPGCVWPPCLFKSWNTVQRYRRLVAAMLRCGR